MVTGHRAFHGETSMATLASVINQEPKPVSEAAPAVPRDLEKLIARCMRKDPTRRRPLGIYTSAMLDQQVEHRRRSAADYRAKQRRLPVGERRVRIGTRVQQ